MSNQNSWSRPRAIHALLVILVAASSAWGVTIATNNLAGGNISREYSGVMTATGGNPPYTWFVAGGALPAGILLDPATGQLTGVPALGGQYTVEIGVRDASGATGTTTFSLPVLGVALDPYGGMLSKPSPNGATGYWRLEKFDGHWMWVTPDGNAFWMIGVYVVNELSGSAYYNHVLGKYGNLKVWGRQAVRRLQAHGFNVLGSFSSPYTQAWYNNPPEQMPSFFQIEGAADALRNLLEFPGQVRPPDPPKDLISCQDLVNGYVGWAGSPTVDAYDPNYSAYLNGELASMQGSFDGPNLQSPWAMALIVDDRDDLFGFGPGPDIPSPDGIVHPHIGWLALAATPSKPARSLYNILYKNALVYSKLRVVRYLRRKYVTIQALNAAWGSDYTSFGSTAVPYWGESIGAGNGSTTTFSHDLLHASVTPGSVIIRVNGTEVAGDNARTDRPAITGPSLAAAGTIHYSTGAMSFTFSVPLPVGASLTVDYKVNGWGSGTGLMDENGRHTAWLGPRSGTLQGVSENVQKDMDNFLYLWACNYFQETTNAVRQYARPHMIVASVDALNGDGGISRKPILLAAAKYNDVIDAQVPNQQVLDLMAQWIGDKPIMSIEFDAANPDSPNSAFPNPDPAGTEVATTQAARGQGYAKQLNFLLNATATPTSSQPVVGIMHFAWADGGSDHTNWGLVTFGLDNLYDGSEDVVAPGVDPWGYSTGGESANYGDFMTPVTQANFGALTQLASAP